MKLWELECDPGVNIGFQIKRTAWSVKNPATTLGGIAGCTWRLAAGCKSPGARRLEQLFQRLFGRRPASQLLEDVATDPETARRRNRKTFTQKLVERTQVNPVVSDPLDRPAASGLCIWVLDGPVVGWKFAGRVLASCEPDLNSYYQVPAGRRWIKLGPA